MEGLLFLTSLTILSSCSADANFKTIFLQTDKEARNESLKDITGKVPHWLTGDLVRQNCASVGNIDGKSETASLFPFDEVIVVAFIR